MDIIFILFVQFILGYALVYMGIPNKYGYSFGSPLMSMIICIGYLGFLTNDVIHYSIDNHIDTITIVSIYLIIIAPMWGGIEFGRKTLIPK